MTYYDYGFLTKCAEHGLSAVISDHLLKLADRRPLTPEEKAMYDSMRQQLSSAGRSSGHFSYDENGNPVLTPVDGDASQPQPAPADPPPAPAAPPPAPAAPSPAPAAPPPAPPPAPPAPPPAHTTPAPPAQQSAQPPAQNTPVANSPQPGNINDLYSGLSDEQKNSFKNWIGQEGRKDMFNSMFTGADGKVDINARNDFIMKHPTLLTGDDNERAKIMRMRVGGMGNDERAAFAKTDAYQRYRQVAFGTGKYANPPQQPQTTANASQPSNDDGMVSWYDPRLHTNVKVQRGAVGNALDAINSVTPKNTQSDAGTTTVTRTYGSPAPRRTVTQPGKRVASFRRNMSVKPLTTTPITSFAGPTRI